MNDWEARSGKMPEMASNKLSGSNWELPHGKLTGYDNLLDMPA